MRFGDDALRHSLSSCALVGGRVAVRFWIDDVTRREGFAAHDLTPET